MKAKDYSTILFHIFSIVSIIYLFWKHEELSTQTRELEKANQNRIEALFELKNQTKEMKINNILNNEKLLFDLKEYLIKSKVNTFNRETFIERLKAFIIAKKFRASDSTEHIEIPSLDLSICNLNNEKIQFKNVNFSQSKIPLFLNNTDFSSSIINLDSKITYKQNYIFKKCRLVNTFLYNREYYKIIFYRCDLDGIKLFDKSNIHEVLAIECENIESLKKRGASIMTETELEEEVRFLKEKTERIYGELLSNTFNNLSTGKDFRKGDSIILKTPFDEEFTVYNHIDPIIEESIEKYTVQLSLFNLRKKQLTDLTYLKSY